MQLLHTSRLYMFVMVVKSYQCLRWYPGRLWCAKFSFAGSDTLFSCQLAPLLSWLALISFHCDILGGLTAMLRLFCSNFNSFSFQSSTQCSARPESMSGRAEPCSFVRRPWAPLLETFTNDRFSFLFRFEFLKVKCLSWLMCSVSTFGRVWLTYMPTTSSTVTSRARMSCWQRMLKSN